MPQILPTRVFDDALLSPYRLIGDAPADAVVEALVAQQGMKALKDLMSFLTDTKDFDFTKQPSAVAHFIVEHSQFPAWSHRPTMQKGIDFFIKHQSQIALLLGCYSLPYCYAAAQGAQVLWLSERIKNDTLRRLEETGEFVFAIMQARDWDNGRNFVRILKVRLMHAVVRYFTRHSPQWNNDWGLPINQEDMSGTNLAFSYIVIRGLRKLNIATTPQEEEAYLHFWNVVGELLGVDEILLPQNLREAYHLDRAIARRHFQTSEAGVGLTKALLNTLQTRLAPPNLSNLPVAQMRYLLGQDIADLLQIPPVDLEENILKIAIQSPFSSYFFRIPNITHN
ncbi:MAG: oxygenase MpaB family protein [Runella sp.]